MKKQSEVEVEGPGFRRMKARLGPERMESMRQRVLREQEEVLAAAAARPRRAAPTFTDKEAVRFADSGETGVIKQAGPEQSLVKWADGREMIVPNSWLVRHQPRARAELKRRG